MKSVLLPAGAAEATAVADRLFLDRWSPRAFDPEPIEPEVLRALFDAARHAPSSFNEQPWLFLYATNPRDRARFLEIINEFNRSWAKNAPAIVFLAARKTTGREGSPNSMAKFDAGAAWMSLALQARMLGLDTHAMGGIDRERAHDVLGLPRDDYEIIIAIAIGRRGNRTDLPPLLAQREGPSPRKPLTEIAHEGSLVVMEG